MAQVAVIIGSESDRGIVEESKMLNIFTEIGVSWELSIISAHRNPDDLRQYCLAAEKNGTLVFIGVAGMAAALPGAIASYVRHRPVIGVPLISGIPGGLDALLSMAAMPPGVPVIVVGIDKPGLYNAAIAACQIIAQSNAGIEQCLKDFIAQHQKPAQIAVASSI